MIALLAPHFAVLPPTKYLLRNYFKISALNTFRLSKWGSKMKTDFHHSHGSAVFMSEAKMVHGFRRWFFLTSPYSGSCCQAYWHHAHICMYIRNMTFSMFASLPAFFCFLHKYPKGKVEKNRIITATESNIYVMIHVKFVCLLENGNSIFYRKTVSLELFWCLGDAY